jgi:hypothetical protein
MKFFEHLFITIIFLGLSSQCLAQVEKDSLRILFVGNSYTYVSNMPHLVSLISDSTSVKLVTSKSTAGGATLSDHWNGAKGLKSKDAISSGKYDIVVIQGHSMEAIEKQDEFLNYSKKLSDLVKASGAKPYLYVTWARQKVPQYQETITETYRLASRQNDCGLIMVGEAWKLARTLRPDIQLFTMDGSHQSDLGAYLTALVFVGNLSGEIPKSFPSSYQIQDTNGEQVMLLWENDLDMIFCQKTASEFIKNQH